MGMILSKLQNIGKVWQIDRYAQGIVYFGGSHIRKHFWQARLKFWEIEMAMRVYEHDSLF
jgi:hypothetical protein